MFTFRKFVKQYTYTSKLFSFFSVFQQGNFILSIEFVSTSLDLIIISLFFYLQTIQSAAFLQELQSQPAAQVRGPFLIVAPLSLIDQWQSELRSWAPDMNVILYHGSADARDFLVKQEFYFNDQFVPKADAAKLRKLQVTKFTCLLQLTKLC